MTDETGTAADRGKSDGPDAEPRDGHRILMRGGASAAFGFVIRLGARLVFLFVAGRLYGATLFGAFSIAVAVVELAVTVGALGAKRQLFKLIEDEHGDRSPAHILVDTAVAVGAASAAIAAAIMLTVALLPGGLVATDTRRTLILLAPMIGGQALMDLMLAATRWTHLMRYEVTARSVIEPYAGVAVSAAAWFAGLGGIGLAAGYWAGTLAALGYALFGVCKCFGGAAFGGYRFEVQRAVALVRVTAVPTVADFANALFARADVYIVGILLGEAPAGIYGMARQVRTPIRQVRQSFDGMLAPLVARTLRVNGPLRTGQALASASRLILAIQLPVLVALAVAGQPLLRALGPGFVAGYGAMLMLAAGEAIQGAFGVGDLIFLFREPRVALRVTLVGVAVNIAAGFALIGPLGVNGAAVAVLAAFAASAAVRRHALATRYGIATHLAFSAGPCLAALVSAAVAFAGMALLRSTADWLRLSVVLAASLAAYGGALKFWMVSQRTSLAMTGFATTDAGPDPS